MREAGICVTGGIGRVGQLLRVTAAALFARRRYWPLAMPSRAADAFSRSGVASRFAVSPNRDNFANLLASFGQGTKR